VKVGFFHAGPSPVHLELAQVLIRSVRRAMPGVPIVHLTDIDTPPIAGVDDVRRRPAGPIAMSVLEHYAGCYGDWLLVDTDVVVRRDVRAVFDLTFDIAVATREGTFKPSEIGTKFMKSMPFNKGVVFSRNPAFWAAAAKALREASEKQQSWMGDQRAMNDIIATARFFVRVLTNAFNYPPKRRDEDLSDKYVLHYKGPRKAWMLELA